MADAAPRPGPLRPDPLRPDPPRPDPPRLGPLRLGTRVSALALAQSGHVADEVSARLGRPVELPSDDEWLLPGFWSRVLD